jgi:N-acetylmuramoyl-L-alanine amidase
VPTLTTADSCRLRLSLHAGLAKVCALALAVGLLAAVPVSGQRPTARELFDAARAEEDAIRITLAHPERAAPDPTREDYLHATGAYRLVVARYPTSGYCDDALWSAGQLASESFARFGADADRRAAIDLYARLAREYPASRRVAEARAESNRLSAPATSRAVAPTAPPVDPLPPPSAPAAPTTAAAATVPATVPATTPSLMTVRDIRRRTIGDGMEVEIETDGPVNVRSGRLDRPPRLFLDLTPAQATNALRDAILTYESGPIRQVRVGRPAPQTTRVVVETSPGVSCDSRTLTDPHRLIVTCREQAVSTAPRANTPPPPASNATTDAAPPAPQPAPVIVATPAARPDGAAGAGGDAGNVNTGDRPAPPSANARGGYSMARQLGLRVGRIVIDPGHGGRDPGAMGQGTSESAITLDIALRLEKLLAKEPGVEVVLTRRTDEFVTLQERPEIASRENADLFVSIHVNAHRDKSISGVETFLLNFASTPDAAAVAARENASSSLTMSHLNDLVKQIALGNKLQESNDLAGHVQGALVKKLTPANRSLRDLGVKQAPFVVLVGAAMPSVLVEVAFLTNSLESRLLATGAYRQKIAEGLLDGLRRYLRTLKRAEAVADGGAARSATPVR